MGEETFRFVEILNRLKRGTLSGKVVWRTDENGQMSASLDNGCSVTVTCPLTGGGVLFRMENEAGAGALDLDSRCVTEDLLRLALLQLFVTARDSITLRRADEALSAVQDL